MQAYSTQLTPARLKDLRPTQISVGMRAVDVKVQHWEDMKEGEREAKLANRWFPAVQGPGEVFYVTDHHHHGLALLRCKVKEVQLLILKDLSLLHPKEFWMAMDHQNWVHPYDAKGRRRDFSELPHKLSDLTDDPYRSLASQIEKLGGYAESGVPYAEFLWADFFRRRVTIGRHRAGWERAVGEALATAHSVEAQGLPGWCGASD